MDKAIILMWLDELSYEEIAQNMGIPRNTVASRLSRILALTIAGIYCSPIPYRPNEIVFISIATVICYSLEFITYRSNIKKINKIQNWLNEP